MCSRLWEGPDESSAQLSPTQSHGSDTGLRRFLMFTVENASSCSTRLSFSDVKILNIGLPIRCIVYVTFYPERAYEKNQYRHSLCMPRAKRHFQRKAKHYDHKPRSPRAPNTGLHKHSLQMATGQFVPVVIYYESSLPRGKPDVKMGEMENPLISGTAFAKRKMQNSTQGKYQCYKPEHLLE